MNSKSETESSNSMKSEELAKVVDPFHLDGRDKGAIEPKKNMEKLRSIRVSRLPTFRARTRRVNGYAASSEDSTPMAMSDVSPNLTKTTSCSNGKKENYQARRSTLNKPAKSLTKMPSTKGRRPLMRKLSGEADQKKKLKKARSIKSANFESTRSSRRVDNYPGDQISIILSTDEETSSETTGCSDSREEWFQASPRNSESTSAMDRSGKSSSSVKKISESTLKNKSFRGLTRMSSLRPLRISRMASLKSRRPSMKKCSEVSSSQKSSIHRATWSSSLKDSKLPGKAELQSKGNGSEQVPATRVCPYTYCSLHGHHHADLPPVKQFVSTKRRLLRTQSSRKGKSRSSNSGNNKKGSRTNQMACSRYPASEETAEEGVSVTLPTSKKFTDFSLQELRDTKDSDNLHSMCDDTISTCQERVPLDEKVHREVDEDITFRSNSEKCKGDSASYTKKLDADTSSMVTDESSNESSGLLSSGFVESVTMNSVAAIAITASESLVEPNSSRADEEEDSEADPQGFPSAESSTPTFTIDGKQRTNMGKQKHVGLWNLIYQHMVKCLDEEAEIQKGIENETRQGVENKEHEEDTKLLYRVDGSASCQALCRKDQVTSVEGNGAGGQKIGFNKSDAVKLVQEAFNKILSEIPDNSSDDQSIASDITSEQELKGKNAEGRELSISTSFRSAKESVERDTDEIQHEAKIVITVEDKESEPKMENKSNQQMSRSWSNLKRVLILKRFVKALEKVRNFNPRKQQDVALGPDSEAEKIHLRRQTMEERKNSEEWMLDYALQKVISTLAPSQKRKVALLVQAFETVIPLPEIGTRLRSDTEASSHATPIESCSGSPVQRSNAAGKENNVVLPDRTCFPETSLKGNLCPVRDFHIIEQHLPTTASPECDYGEGMICNASSETNDRDLKAEEISAFSHRNNPILTDDQAEPVTAYSLVVEEPGLWHKSPEGCSSDQKTPENVGSEAAFDFGSEANTEVSEFNLEKLESGNLMDAGTEQSDRPRTPRADSKGDKPECGFSEESPSLEESEPNYTIDVVRDTKFEKQRNMRLWYLIYKRMASGKITEDGSQNQLEETGKKEQDGDNNLLRTRTSDCHSVIDQKDQDANMRNHNADRQKIELHQMEAIKLVEQAIDEIPFPETEDDSVDDQSVNSDMIPDQDLLEEKHGEEERLFNSTSSYSSNSLGASNSMAKQNRTADSNERWLNSDDLIKQEEGKTAPKIENKSKPQMQKSWSNLKKVILLRRFVKALEKIRKFNPAEPRLLPVNPDPDTEKIQLRHQDMEDRKLAEEWMLDYALQQVVAKLTPARKRKVKLLVEAFETVIPTVGS